MMFKKKSAVFWAQKRPRIQIPDTKIAKTLRPYFENLIFWYLGYPDRVVSFYKIHKKRHAFHLDFRRLIFNVQFPGDLSAFYSKTIYFTYFHILVDFAPKVQILSKIFFLKKYFLKIYFVK